MAAMLPGTGGGSARTANPYEAYDNPVEEDDLIDPDDGEDRVMCNGAAQMF